MAGFFSECLKLVNERLEHGVEWVENPILSRSPTPIAIRSLSTSPPRDIPDDIMDDIINRHKKAILDCPDDDALSQFYRNVYDYPGDIYPMSSSKEGFYRFVPKSKLGVGMRAD
jgi:hypothetical protein